MELDLSSGKVSEGGGAVAVAVLAGALGAIHSGVDAAGARAVGDVAVAG